MVQYGDIKELNGAALTPVDLIAGGSPCQNFSIAGNRAGLEGEQSSLFLEMVRIIKEMRYATDLIRPRFALFENVTGLFSSNNGNDFSHVLGEFARIIEPNAPDVPTPEMGWSEAGVLLVQHGSIAWRTVNAKYWGTPQSRRRIALVVDFRGQSASEILYEPRSLQGNTQKSGEIRQTDTNATERSVGKDCAVLKCQDRAGKEGGGKGLLVREDYIGALGCSNIQGILAPSIYDSQVYHSCKEYDETFPTVTSRYGTGGNNQPLIVTASVRRLTPLEAERLQGFPDGWTDIEGATDSKRFKAIGNSIALPFWIHLAKRFAEIGKVETLGSLFDGIGGFPLAFQKANVKTLWTSEIEPFCRKVTKIRFKEQVR